MHDLETLYQDADRVRTTDEDGERTWVVLAEDALDGVDLVLVADEAELLGPVEDMTVAVYRSSGSGAQRRVEPIDDEALEDRAFDHFFELMGFEGA